MKKTLIFNPKHGKNQYCIFLFKTLWRAATATLALAIVFVLTVVVSQPAQAQTFKVLHTFTIGGNGANPDAYTSLHDFNGDDGYDPVGNLLLDAHGNFYGTTTYRGGVQGLGVVWEITP